MGKIFDWDNICLWYAPGVAMLFECVTLVRVICLSRNIFAITILILLIAGNVVIIAAGFVPLKIRPRKVRKIAEICSGLQATTYLLFNVAHWMFAHKYFSMSRQLPCKLAKLKVPRSIVWCDRITNLILISLNAIAPIAYGYSAIGALKALKHRNWNLMIKYGKIENISFQITQFLPLISGVYLFTALYYIRKYKRKEVQINIRTMAVHATSFLLYIVSSLIYL